MHATLRLGVAVFALASSGCAGIAVVDAGHIAVMLASDGEMSVLDEGAFETPPDAVVDDFDLREQQQAGTFVAVTKDGVPVGVGYPTILYRWVPEELIAADRELGAQGAKPLIDAVVASNICRVLATYRWDQLDTPHIREAQDRVTQLSATALRPRHLALLSVELKGLTPRLSAFAHEIVRTSEWEQKSLQARSRLELAKQNADRLRAMAQGIADANAHLQPTLTPEVLNDKANRAWQALLRAPSTQVEVSTAPSPNVEVTP
jgi:hypothetical protein